MEKQKVCVSKEEREKWKEEEGKEFISNPTTEEYYNLKKVISESEELKDVLVKNSHVFIELFNLDIEDQETMVSLFTALTHFLQIALTTADKEGIDIIKEIKKLK